MNKKITISILLVGALGIAAVFGVLTYRNASASTPQQAGLSHISFAKGINGGSTDTYLAQALGISTDELTAAYQKAIKAALDQAVKDGLITQAQADQLSAKGFAFPFGNRWAGWLQQNGIDFDKFFADALGISVEKLQAAYVQAQNTRIDQAVTDGKLTQEQADLMKGEHALYANKNFQSSMQSAFEAAVKQAVTDGVITQAQADQILSNATNKGFPFLGKFGRGFGGFGDFDGFGGHGRRGGWEFGTPANPNTPNTPTSPSSGGF